MTKAIEDPAYGEGEHEAYGAIEREPDPVDGRAHVLVLTGEGRQRLEDARTARRDRWHALLATWPVDDVSRMAGMLARFNQLIASRPAA